MNIACEILLNYEFAFDTENIQDDACPVTAVQHFYSIISPF